MFKLLLIGVIAISMLSSCKKKPPVTSTNTSQDTLSAGWTMSKIDLQQFTNIRFIENNGVAVSTSAIYVSNNGGVSWQQRLSYGNQVFGIGYGWRRNVGMDSVGNVIVPQGLYNIGASGYSLVSSHDYNNYQILPEKFSINDSWFMKNNFAYAITASQQDTNIHFLRTIDGGSSWNTVSILPRIGNISQTGPTRLAFINSQTGWASTPYGMFKTTNGGQVWSHLYVPPGIITNISAVDANTCYIEFIAFQRTTGVEIDKISKTTDGGANWQEVLSENTGLPSLGPSIQAFQFVNSTTGYMVRGKWIYKSTDGGVSWVKEVSIHSSLCGFTDIYFTDANHGWACSSEGQILRYQH
jgi:photosystem II stability/assembly factor-like uncharacterized protein